MTAPWRVYLVHAYGAVRFVRSGLSPRDMRRTVRLLGGSQQPGVLVASTWLVEPHDEPKHMGSKIHELADLIHPTRCFHPPRPFDPTSAPLGAQPIGDDVLYWSETDVAWMRMSPNLDMVPAAIDECTDQWRTRVAAGPASAQSLHAIEYMCEYAKALRAAGDASLADDRDARRAEIEQLQATLRDLMVQCDAALEHASRTIPRPGP